MRLSDHTLSCQWFGGAAGYVGGYGAHHEGNGDGQQDCGVGHFEEHQVAKDQAGEGKKLCSFGDDLMFLPLDDTWSNLWVCQNPVLQTRIGFCKATCCKNEENCCRQQW